MAPRKARAGIALAGVVIVGALATAGALAAVLSQVAERRAAAVENRGATTTSVTTTEAAVIDGVAQPGIAAAAPSAPTTSALVHRTASQGSPELQLTVGDCVAVAASGSGLEKTSCGSGTSAYTVTHLATDGAPCPSDVDRSHQRALPDGEHDALCLDIAWVPGTCMDLSGDMATPVDCTSAAPGRVRVVEIKRNTTDVNACSAGDQGFVYDERRYVVCVAS
ncbi:hypothetical protein [Nocardia otitidiscaviarum]|uniref:hypothetical protein n=1 Tax=Nocardia otitidiscaviarum TaxID=1823 RepID=UPI0018931189|nr:hypothetical protein [Nocardia otitidiscaviarum]MBF6179538.1 hypothetical protein [Nocardia otitidiscaviarum]